MAESKTATTTTTTSTDPSTKEKITEKVHEIKEKVSRKDNTTNDANDIEITKHDARPMTHDIHTSNTTSATSTTEPVAPSKMHAAKEKLVGGIKETIGTVVHAEGMKEAGREQKREGDAEALAAGKGKKHYDPALARKGVGIQHKHMGPNPKKLTEGPCAGCKDGTCQIGHDYDAAICHSCTQGHCDAGHVKAAGLPTQSKAMHGDGVAVAAPCCNHSTIPPTTTTTGAPVQISEPFNVVAHSSAGSDSVQPVTGHIHAGEPLVRPHQNTAPVVASGHNTAYDAAACPSCTDTVPEPGWHSKRDKDMMDKMEAKKVEKDKKIMEKQEKKIEKQNKD